VWWYSPPRTAPDRRLAHPWWVWPNKVGGRRVAVDVEQLAPLPDRVAFATAATLPIAGVTALRTLRLGREVTGLADWADKNRSG
jgi:NADPH:quinone reductase-like Zn-dependent oxidoreductase